MHIKAKDETGRTFGRWTVLRRIKTSSNAAYWLCRCECGNEVNVQGRHLRNGQSKQCTACQGAKKRKHCATIGDKPTTEYQIWCGIIKRCENPSEHAFDRYGGRGVKICDRWRHSFAAFLEDMGNRPSRSHSIDRFPDKNGDYEPGNCRWATYLEQAQNTRSNRILTHDGKSLCVAEWERRLGLNSRTLNGRLKLGWTIDRALTTPPPKIRKSIDRLPAIA